MAKITITYAVLLIALGTISPNIRNPDADPSHSQTSWPWTPSSAVKYSFPSLCCVTHMTTRLLGFEEVP
ncbi:hypothetical protein BH09SUM1_BH09SUM1_20700 [soil metagenome]